MTSHRTSEDPPQDLDDGILPKRHTHSRTHGCSRLMLCLLQIPIKNLIQRLHRFVEYNTSRQPTLSEGGQDSAVNPPLFVTLVAQVQDLDRITIGHSQVALKGADNGLLRSLDEEGSPSFWIYRTPRNPTSGRRRRPSIDAKTTRKYRLRPRAGLSSWEPTSTRRYI